MGYTINDYQNPVKMFEMRTRQLRVRIQTLQGFLEEIAIHPYSKAIVKQELDKAVDEYVARKLQERAGKTN